MPLTWNVKGIKNYEQVTTHPEDLHLLGTEETIRWNPITETLVWLSTFCGYCEITEKTARNVAIRIDIYEQASGVMLRTSDGKDRPITYADVKQHIGLRTNASEMTMLAFKQKIWRILVQNSTDHIDRQIKEMGDESTS